MKHKSSKNNLVDTSRNSGDMLLFFSARGSASVWDTLDQRVAGDPLTYDIEAPLGIGHKHLSQLLSTSSAVVSALFSNTLHVVSSPSLSLRSSWPPICSLGPASESLPQLCPCLKCSSSLSSWGRYVLLITWVSGEMSPPFLTMTYSLAHIACIFSVAFINIWFFVHSGSIFCYLTSSDRK